MQAGRETGFAGASLGRQPAELKGEREMAGQWAEGG